MSYRGKWLTNIAIFASDYDRHSRGYRDVRASSYWNKEQLADFRGTGQPWSTDVCGSVVSGGLFH